MPAGEADRTGAFPIDDAALFDQVNDAIIVTDPDLRILRWNRGAQALYGWLPEEAIGRRSSEIVRTTRYLGADGIESVLETLYERGVWTGTAVQSHRDGRELFVDASVRLIRDAQGQIAGFVTINRDITERVRLLEREQAARRRLEVLGEASHAFAMSGSALSETLDTVARRTAELIGDACSIRLLSEDGLLMPGPTYHPDPEALEFLRHMLAASIQRVGEGLNGRVAQTGQPILLPRVAPEQVRAMVKPEYIAYVERFGVHSCIVVPLRIQEQVIGTLTVVRDRTPEPYTGDDQLLLQDLADRAALAINNAQLLQATEEARQSLERRVEERTAELRELSRRYELVLQAAGEGIFGLDQEGRTTFVNPAAARMLGWDVADLVGKPQHEFIHHSRSDGTPYPLEACPISATVRDGQPCRVSDELFWRKDGSPFPVEYISTPIWERDQLIGAVVTFNDITARIRAEQETRQARQEAERANAAKSEFLSRMSHELRTPMNAILGFAQILEMENLPSQQRESLEYILKGGQHLLELINEVLDISRIESGKFTIAVEPIQAEEVIRESLALIAPLAAQSKVSVESDLRAARNRSLQVDRQRLKQVLVNLLSNAVKYNRQGGSVTVLCEALPERRLRIAVRDTGSGIAPERQSRLFTPFDRLGAERTTVEGTGLGLALTKRLTEAMGGTLGFVSEPGRGSTFWVELPMIESPPAQAQPAPAPLEARKPKASVLYIEDNLSNLSLVQQLIRRHSSIALLSAMQGSLGLDLAQQHRPNLILLDLHLPDLPGEVVLRKLRADPRTSAIPVVIISADATPRQIERLLADGARAYLTKPLDVRRFLQVLDEILNGRIT